MRPFWYLLFCRIVNGVGRSFKTPVRAGMTVLLALYIIFSISSLFLSTSRPRPASPVLTMDPQAPLALLTLAHLALCLYILAPPKYMFTVFSEIDVANLYPAPIDRWRTFRFFLFMRSFLALFFLMGIGAAYGFWFLRIAVPGLFARSVGTSLTLVMIGYAALVVVALAGLLFWRMVIDIRREYREIPRHLFLVTATLVLGGITAIVVAEMFAAVREGSHPILGLSTAVGSFPLAFILAPFRLLAELMLGRAEPLSFSFWASLVFWFGLMVTGYRALKGHDRQLYNYAERLATFRAQMMEGFRNPAARVQQRKQKGQQTFSIPWFLRGMNPRRAGALFWRDMIVAWRSFGTVVQGLHHIFLLVVIGGWVLIERYHVPINAKGVWVASGIAAFMGAIPLAMVSIYGFSELLKRAEVQKPLPISPHSAVTMHVLQWTVMIAGVTFLPFVSGMLFFHQYWTIILFMLLVGWSFTYAIVSGYFFVTLFNPDQLDPIQRMYAALFGLAVAIGATIPSALVIIVGSLMKVPLFLIAIIVVACNVLSAEVLHYFSARKYVNFVFTE